MKSRIALLVLGLSSSLNIYASGWDGRILDVKTQASLSATDLAERLSSYDNIVLGEKHNTPAVQLAQSTIIQGVVQMKALDGRFTTAWEFLNFTDQQLIDQEFEKLSNKTISPRDFLIATQGDDYNQSYIPILETTSALHGQLLGVNITREAKAPIVEHGIGAADPKLVPPGFALGDADYLERFTQAMLQGHATADQIPNYFAAQCLTDDVMAYHLINDSKYPTKFLVTGSFHTEYFDAAVKRIEIRAPLQKTVVVRLIDASDYVSSDLLGLLHDAKYGDVADYVFYVNEPHDNR